MTKKVSDLSDGGRFAAEVSSLVLTKNNYESMLQDMVGSLLQAMGLPEAQQQITALVLEAMPYAEMLVFNAEVYGKRFENSELQELVAFYKTPVGAKLVSELSGISKDLNQLVNEHSAKQVPTLIQKYLENMVAREDAAQDLTGKDLSP